MARETSKRPSDAPARAGELVREYGSFADLRLRGPKFAFGLGHAA
jgi:hypothetical protein